MDPIPPSEVPPAPKPHSHSRHTSFNRYSLPRRSTIGPLDVEDPLGAGTSPASVKSPSDPPNASISPSSDLSHRAIPGASPQASSRDFSYLQRPEIYHSLTQLDLPAAFRTPVYQPDPSLPPLVHLASSNFRSAAIAAAHELCNRTNLTAPEIFSLFYIRLSCLTLIDGTAIAADESKALQDLNSSFYRDEETHLHFVPWELRVLAVRLQGIGYGDARRAISGYYDLARDAREEIARTSGEERILWEERLEDLGLRVGNALIESGDVSGAIRHFKSLRMSTKGENNELRSGRLAMLYIHLGDLASAKICMDEARSAHNSKILHAALYPLLSMAEGRYDDAIKEWKDILSDSKSIMATQNLAVCLIYVGRMDETTSLLTSLISAGHSFHALTFNLATVYELCTEKARTKKIELAETIAAGIEKRGEGGERSNSDFKL